MLVQHLCLKPFSDLQSRHDLDTPPAPFSHSLLQGPGTRCSGWLCCCFQALPFFLSMTGMTSLWYSAWKTGFNVSSQKSSSALPVRGKAFFCFRLHLIHVFVIAVTTLSCRLIPAYLPSLHGDCFKAEKWNLSERHSVLGGAVRTKKEPPEQASYSTLSPMRSPAQGHRKRSFLYRDRSVITLNVNGLNNTTKRKRLTEWV